MSLLPQLLDPSAPAPERTLVLQAHRGNAPTPGHHFALRRGDWKLVRASGFGRWTPREDASWELYDLVKDPDEQTNVYDDPAYAKVRDQLKKQFAELRKQVGDDGSHHPECEKVVQEFWDYDEADRKKAIEISRAFKERREAELARRKKK